MSPRRGEVWLWDCGMAKKVRPVLILSVPFDDEDRALVSFVMHTTSLRESKWEVPVTVSFLRAGAFLTQSVETFPVATGIRRLGVLTPEQFERVETAVFRWLGRSC
ncbi:MAG: type II toxin-antitoxin system PemK/MazF family toxin [Prosthecobacter sp.]|uniref:type II toxin-antitoxin system PemK/MazF family toxin n=1 Tax=Prosthecobacter sp. TaxID=1965333 RepID=UPI0039029BF3